MEYFRRKVIRPRNSPPEDAPLADFVPGSSDTALALLDIEGGDGELTSRRKNGHLTAPTPSPTDRSRSTSPLYTERNGFLFPPRRNTTGPDPKELPMRHRRFVSKSGECFVRHRNVQRKGLKYLADIFTTLVDCRWRFCALIFSMGFFSTWLFYATLYYIFAWMHDDLERTEQEDWVPCVNKIRDFSSAYLYSLETQHTIGYGYRFANTECPHVIIVLCLQCLTGVALQSILVGVLFAKLSRPKMRSETLMFSREACICQRDGRLHFMFRVGDMRRSHIVEAHIRVMCMKERVTQEGEQIPFHQFDMDVGFASGTDRLFLVWPTIISHEIDEHSPLYDVSADNLESQDLEVIVILEGIVEATGLTTQARTSYLPSEIRWGHRFEKVVRPSRDGICFDHDYFNKMSYVDSTPKMSARELFKSQVEERERQAAAEGRPLELLPPLAPEKVPHTLIAQQRRRRSSAASNNLMERPTMAEPVQVPCVPEITIRRASYGTQAEPVGCSTENGTTAPISLQNVELPRIR